MKKKLLYILHDIHIGGVEVALLSAIPELHRQFNLKVLVLGKVDQKMIAHFSEEEKSCFHAFPSPLLHYPAAIFRMVSFALQFKPDVMICSLWRASMIGIIVKRLRKQVTFISFVHNTTFFHRLDAYFTKSAICLADTIFTDSAAVSAFVKAKFNPNTEVTTISFITNKSPVVNLHQLFDKNELRFIYLGRIHRTKNIPLAIDTIDYLRSKGLNASLDIYGRNDGALDEVLAHIRHCSLESVIAFKGELVPAEKQEVIKTYQFLIQLSDAEGMAMSVAEAMQNGLVCFVTPVGEIPNYATDGVSAIFADISTTDTFARSLEKLLATCQDPKSYQVLSDVAFTAFSHVQTYSESLTAAIEAFTLTTPKSRA
ncbi:glycosyltransferase family 4 protein [Dyadobacter sandarakinus]|uniref:Glycosyltransferase family 4 protein n=1 Tax=Dyadobacter sandarakinus TaxID=2747268 RepID=A0ABX7ICE0_9BACT|nr:glycosyltransferase family 4 protein [Dyadobacter sandarakinus]QRR03388.1 glycosyltransferase family 4 protein [Dyadobacter sandarakinus]